MDSFSQCLSLRRYMIHSNTNVSSMLAAKTVARLACVFNAHAASVYLFSFVAQWPRLYKNTRTNYAKQITPSHSSVAR